MEFRGKLSIIIPCYNEQAIIVKTHNRILTVLENNELDSYEILYVDDGSNDATLEKLRTIATENRNVKIISLSRNFGHQRALTAGIHMCSGDLAIIIDADLQDPPELFPDLIKTYLKENCNMVYCVRNKRIGEKWFKKITAKWFYRFLQKISEIPFPVDTGDFRLIDKKIIDSFKLCHERNKFIRGLLCWLGFKQVPFYFDRKKREEGKTKYSFKKMLTFSINGITYFSYKPLYWALKLGLLSFLLMLFSMIIFFFTDVASSLTASILTGILVTVLLFACSFILFALGIIGIYLRNIFDEQKDRPEYIIEEIING